MPYGDPLEYPPFSTADFDAAKAAEYYRKSSDEIPAKDAMVNALAAAAGSPASEGDTLELSGYQHPNRR